MASDSNSASVEPGDAPLTWQQTKSQLTRTAILEAAVACFYELGYAKTTTENIAQKAKVSRGAMLHHFPSRFELTRATINHLNQLRVEMFATEEYAVQQGAEHSRIAEGIDAYWRQLNTPVFVVLYELQIAARTDAELRDILAPALAAIDKTWDEVTKDVFPDLALSAEFERATSLTKYLLEGMAAARFSGSDNVPEKALLNWLKAELKRSFRDVHGSVKRPTPD